MKDTKRLFSEADKREIMSRQNGHCHDCDEMLTGDNAAAHHVVRHADGGPTEVENGVMVCSSCHSVRHSKAWPLLRGFRDACDPRFIWQVRGLFRFAGRVLDGKESTVAEAVMAGGKTRFSIQCMMLLRELKGISTTIILVPSRSIANDYEAEIRAVCPGLLPAAVRRGLIKKATEAFQVPTEDWIIALYQEATKPKTASLMHKCFAEWKKSRWSFGLVCDEIHHTHSHSPWGAVSGYGGHASHSLIQSGTMFRSDRQRIASMEYGLVGEPIVHVAYRLDEALAAKNVRPVSFRWVDACDSEVPITYVVRESGNKVERTAERISDIPRDIQASVVKKLMTPGTGPLWIPIYRETVATLERFRSHPATANAKALICSEPGYEGTTELRFVEQTAAAWTRSCPQKPTVVVGDDPAAQDMIKSFRENKNAKYLAAINMVSEGTNIPWLMTLGLFRCIQSEMLFHQLAGRIMRTTCGGSAAEWGRIVLPRTQDHIEFAETFELANRRVLGVCDVCGQFKPCECVSVCSRCGDPLPCDCIKPPPPPSQPRVIDAFAMPSEAMDGTAEGCTIQEDYISDASYLLGQIGSRADEILYAKILKAAEDANRYTRVSGHAGGGRIVCRDAVLATLTGLRTKYAKHSNMAAEDSDVLIYRRLGVSSAHDLPLMTVEALKAACVAVQEMIIDVIRRD